MKKEFTIFSLLFVLSVSVFAKPKIKYNNTLYLAKSVQNELNATNEEVQDYINKHCQNNLERWNFICSLIGKDRDSLFNNRNTLLYIEHITYISEGVLISQYIKTSLVNKKKGFEMFNFQRMKDSVKPGEEIMRTYAEDKDFNSAQEMNDYFKVVLFPESSNSKLYNKYTASFNK